MKPLRALGLGVVGAAGAGLGLFLLLTQIGYYTGWPWYIEGGALRVLMEMYIPFLALAAILLALWGLAAGAVRVFRWLSGGPRQ